MSDRKAGRGTESSPRGTEAAKHKAVTYPRGRVAKWLGISHRTVEKLVGHTPLTFNDFARVVVAYGKGRWAITTKKGVGVTAIVCNAWHYPIHFEKDFSPFVYVPYPVKSKVTLGQIMAAWENRRSSVGATLSRSLYDGDDIGMTAASLSIPKEAVRAALSFALLTEVRKHTVAKVS